MKICMQGKSASCQLYLPCQHRLSVFISGAYVDVTSQIRETNFSLYFLATKKGMHVDTFFVQSLQFAGYIVILTSRFCS